MNDYLTPRLHGARGAVAVPFDLVPDGIFRLARIEERAVAGMGTPRIDRMPVRPGPIPAPGVAEAGLAG